MGCENHHGSASHCLVQLEPQRVLSELRLALQERAASRQALRAAL
jgi:hypothetical protein